MAKRFCRQMAHSAYRTLLPDLYLNVFYKFKTIPNKMRTSLPTRVQIAFILILKFIIIQTARAQDTAASDTVFTPNLICREEDDTIVCKRISNESLTHANVTHALQITARWPGEKIINNALQSVIQQVQNLMNLMQLAEKNILQIPERVMEILHQRFYVFVKWLALVYVVLIAAAGLAAMPVKIFYALTRPPRSVNYEPVK